MSVCGSRAPRLRHNSNRQVFFNASAHVTVPAGGSVTSDPVPLRVMAQQDLAVSLHIPEADVRPSQHSAAQVTSYLTANGAGDTAADETAAPFTATTTSTFWVKSIDVLSSISSGAIVAFGDSITDGTCSTLDGHDRWEDVLAMRLAFDASSRGSADAHKAVVNEGIGGNTITREKLQPPPDSTPGLERLERDVLSHHGVTHVVLFMGTNDARREAPAAHIIAGTEDIVRRVKKAGLKIVGATMIPRHNRPPAENNTGWSDGQDAGPQRGQPVDPHQGALRCGDRLRQDGEGPRERRPDQPAVQLRRRDPSQPARLLRDGSIGFSQRVQVNTVQLQLL